MKRSGKRKYKTKFVARNWREDLHAQFVIAYRRALRRLLKTDPIKKVIYAKDLTVSTIFFTPAEIAAARRK